MREADGTFVRWSDGMGFLWGAKDELPARGLVCVGKHLARVTACVAPRLLPALVAQAGAGEPEGLEAELVAAIRSAGPLTAAELRDVAGADKREVDRAVAALHRRFVLTSSHLVEQEAGWGALAHDLLERKWTLPRRLPAADDARRELALVVLRSAGELTAADLRGVFGWHRRAAAGVLDGVAPSRDEGEFRIWTAP
ncbi:MAG TPA: crosslink repair DNA glycosylase YcaQ family protein [Gaiellaceae bacterium]